VTVLVPLTAPPVTVKVAEVWPAVTVTVPGTAATAGSLDVSVTRAPPVGAADGSHTVPVVEPPRAMVGALKVIALRAARV
jgi:hypothetical protein